MKIMNKREIDLRKEIDDLVKEFCNEKFQKSKFVPGVDNVPVSGKVLGFEEISNMVNASQDGWLTTGRFNEAFEKKLSAILGIKHLLTVNSGSSANLIAFNTLTSEKLGSRAIKPGDEIIGVAAGFPTTINPQIQFGAIPVFVDVELSTHNIDVTKLQSALSKRTKAVMLAHALGNPFNVSAVKKFCNDNNLWLIEDCCDALGAGNITNQPYLYNNNNKFKISGDLKITNHVMRNSFWLGVYPGLNSDHLEFVCDKVEEFFGIGF